MAKAKILVVDDKPANLQLLEEILERQGYEVKPSPSAQLALRALEHNRPDLILLDINMPQINGFEFAQKLKDNPLHMDIPILFISALTAAQDKVKAFQAGGVDYISKPFQIEEVIARVENHLTIAKLQDDLSSLNKDLEKRVRERTLQLEAESLQRKKALEKANFLASHDNLTLLPNRRAFDLHVKKSFRQAQRAQQKIAVCFLELQGLKAINESFGRPTGDRLLIEVTKRLKTSCTEETPLFRLKGDEFVFILEDIQHEQEVLKFSERLKREFDASFLVDSHQFYIDATLGISCSHLADYDEPLDLLRDANLALQQSKPNASSIGIFSKELRTEAYEKVLLSNDLRRACGSIKNNQDAGFELYYQGIFFGDTKKLCGFEALIRWHHPTRGFVSPGAFIPIAEASGHIVDIGYWTLRKAIEQIAIWHEHFDLSDDFHVNVNLSPLQLSEKNLVSEIQALLQQHKASTKHLKLELTETAIQSNPLAEKRLNELHELGLDLCLDDFGTGYSSLSRLGSLPIQVLKIDQSFIKDLNKKAKAEAMIRSIVQLGHNLGLKVVAEGIETAEQLELLNLLKCDCMQGFYLATPLDNTGIASLLEQSFSTRTKTFNQLVKI